MSLPQPADVRTAEQSVPLDWDAVRAHLAGHGLQLDRDPPPRQFAGGLANLNYLIHLDGKPAVLRRPPLGELPAGAYDMAREFRILSRLPDALPFVPRGLFLCADAGVIGAQFQIIEYRPGLVIREHIPPELAGRPEVGARLSQVLLETHGGDPCGGHRGGRAGRSRPPGGFPGARGQRLAQARAGGAGGGHRGAARRTGRLAGARIWCRMARRRCCTTTSS